MRSYFKQLKNGTPLNAQRGQNMNKFKVYIRTLKNGDIPKETDKFRIRIIYPDGTAEFDYDSWGYSYFSNFFKPCWYKSGMTEKESIKAMKEYDKNYGYKTELLFKF